MAVSEISYCFFCFLFFFCLLLLFIPSSFGVLNSIVLPPPFMDIYCLVTWIYFNLATKHDKMFMTCKQYVENRAIRFPQHFKIVNSHRDYLTVIILNIGTDRSKQTVQTQIRLLLMEQSDQGLLCLLFCLHLLNTILHCKIQLFQL